MSPAAWAFLGVMVSQGVVLAGMFVQQRRTAAEVSQVNRAVNHQPDGSATLVQRVGAIETQLDDFKTETGVNREWEHKAFRALAKEVGCVLPPHPREADGTPEKRA